MERRVAHAVLLIEICPSGDQPLHFLQVLLALSYVKSCTRVWIANNSKARRHQPQHENACRVSRCAVKLRPAHVRLTDLGKKKS